MRRLTSIFVFVLLIANGSILQAYDTQTHREIAERAAQPSVSSLDRVLKTELGVTEGIREVFPGQSVPGPRRVEQLLGDGAFFEDIPATRAFNHFHNPLVERWQDAGLRTFSVFGLPIIRGQSSVLWQQNAGQGTTLVFTPLPLPSGGGNWSWQEARRHYLNALTRARREDRDTEQGRDRAFADMFEALGRLTHLIQDASVPAHVRNDPHLILINPDWYEEWVEDTREDNPSLFRALLEGGRIRPTGPIRPPESIFTPTRDDLAPVPIARLLDTDKFLRGLGNFQVLTDPAIGIAEYTNGNFLSRDTLFQRFDFPRQQSLDLTGFLVPQGAKFRRYFRKRAEGEAIDFFVTEGVLHDALSATVSPPPVGGWFLDERVHEDYANRLLPRAVGYSARLLDYFFRGRLEVALVPIAANPAQVELRVINRSPEAIGPGTLSLYFDNASENRTKVVEWSLTEPVPKDGQAPPISFSRPDGAKRFVLVYRGTLGNEVAVPNTDPSRDFPGAVIGTVFGQQAIEVVSIGTVNGVNGFYLASDQGLFRIPVRDQPASLFDLQSISWGANDNVLLIAYDPEGPERDTFQIHRINRLRGDDVVPTKDTLDPATGLKFVDTTVLAEFPAQPSDFPIPGTLTANVQLNVKRFLAGTIVESVGPSGFPFTRRDFNPLHLDSTVLNFTASTNINLNPQQMASPGGAPSDPIHAFVDENDELIMLYRLHLQPQFLVEGQRATVRSLGTLPPVPGTPPDPNQPCNSAVASGFSDQAPSIGSPFAQFLSLSASDFCTVSIEPALHAPKRLQDYVLINRSTGQILAQSFTDPTFSWEEDVHLLSRFAVNLHRSAFKDQFGQEFDTLSYQRHQQLSDLFNFPNDSSLIRPKSDVFNVTVTDRGGFGVSAGPEPHIFTLSQGTRTLPTGFVYTFKTFTHRYNDDERELIAAELSLPQIFPLRNRGGLALLARNNNFPRSYRVVRLPLPVQAGDPITAQVLTDALTPSNFLSFAAILEAHQTAILAKFHLAGFSAAPPKTFLISGPLDTVRELDGAALPENLRLVLPNSFINDFAGKRRLLMPEFTNGTVAFTPTPIPEEDPVAAGTLPNIITQWHLVGR